MLKGLSRFVKFFRFAWHPSGHDTVGRVVAFTRTRSISWGTGFVANVSVRRATGGAEGGERNGKEGNRNLNQSGESPATARRVLIGLLGLVLLPLLVAIDSRFAIARGWSPTTAGALGKLANLATLIVLAGMAGLIFRSFREVLAWRAGQFWLASVTTLLALGVAEASLRRLFPPPPLHCRPPGVVYQYDPDPFSLPGVFGPARQSINSLGIRGPELPPHKDAYRILCIGGSSTECYYLDDGESWPALLASDINADGKQKVWVGGVGFSEYATGDHLRFLERSPLLDEMDCVVLMTGVNDFLRLLLGFDMGMEPPLWLRSRIVDLVKEFWNVRMRQGYVVDTTGHDLTLRRMGLKFHPRPIYIDTAVEEYEHRLERIIAAAKARGVRVVLVSQPYLWDDFLTTLGNRRLRFARVYPEPREWDYVNPGTCREAMLRYNAALAKVAQREGVAFVDLAKPMAGIEQYYYDDFHLNEKGCEDAAKLLAEWFIAHPPGAPVTNAPPAADPPRSDPPASTP